MIDGWRWPTPINCNYRPIITPNITTPLIYAIIPYGSMSISDGRLSNLGGSVYNNGIIAYQVLMTIRCRHCVTKRIDCDR